MKLDVKFEESNQSFNPQFEENTKHMEVVFGSNIIVGITEETDPTVPDWAKQPKKPVYHIDEIEGTEDFGKGQFFTMVFEYSRDNKRYEAKETIEDALAALDEGRNVIANVDTTDYIPLLSAVRGSNPYMIFSGIYNTTSISFTVRYDSANGVSYGNLNTTYVLDRSSISSYATKSYVTTEINKKATEITKSMNILTSPNGTKFKITVDDSGVLSTTSV